MPPSRVVWCRTVFDYDAQDFQSSIVLLRFNDLQKPFVLSFVLLLLLKPHGLEKQEKINF
jgi:hypothetical protein